MLAQLCSKSFKLGFGRTRTENLQMYKLGLEKAEESEVKLPTFMEKAREFQKNIYFCFIDYAIKPLTMWITTNCGKFLKEIRIPDYLTCPLRNQYARQQATVRTIHGITDWFKIGKKSMSRMYIVTSLI